MRTFGVDHAIDIATRRRPQILKITRGRGVASFSIRSAAEASPRATACWRGRLVIFGLSAAAPGERRSWWRAMTTWAATPRFDPLSMINRNRGVFGLHIGHLWDERRHLAPFVDLLISELAAGRLTPVVARTFALDHVADAHRFIQGRGNIGKVVLTV
jgi:NADPH:quinone reductase-like Zn-dependent oxidoreductase